MASFLFGLSHVDHEYDDSRYNKVLEFLKKVANNEFTGPDEHGD